MSLDVPDFNTSVVGAKSYRLETAVAATKIVDVEVDLVRLHQLSWVNN